VIGVWVHHLCNTGRRRIKPLFQFNKPECFRFEIFFWMEKVLLVGFTEIIGTNFLGDSSGIAQWLLNLSVTLGFLVMIAVYQPSLEPRYNFGNIMMHVVIIYFYVVSLLLNPRVNIHDSAVDSIKMIDGSLVVAQLTLLAYLIWVSFEKLVDMYEKAKLQVTAEREAEEVIRDHLEYFDQLRKHFDDDLAITLTRMHHKVRNRSITPTFNVKMTISPRQARDKHRESTQKRDRFSLAGWLGSSHL
jgi:hypothetical protein